MCRLSWNLGASTFWNPLGLSRPVMGLLYLYLYLLPSCLQPMVTNHSMPELYAVVLSYLMTPSAVNKSFIIIIIIITSMELGHLLTRSGLTYPEVSSKVSHDSFCQLGSSVSLPWVIYFEAFYLHVVSNFSCIPVICPKWVLFLTPLQFVHLFCNLSKCILLFFSCISSLLLLFFWRLFL